MTHVTCRLTTKNRDQLRNPTFGNRVLATFTSFTSDYLRYLRKKTICKPLAHPTWKCSTLTCEVPKFFLWLKVCIVLAFSVLAFSIPADSYLLFAVGLLAFSSTCVFSAPSYATGKGWHRESRLLQSHSSMCRDLSGNSEVDDFHINWKLASWMRYTASHWSPLGCQSEVYALPSSLSPLQPHSWDQWPLTSQPVSNRRPVRSRCVADSTHVLNISAFVRSLMHRPNKAYAADNQPGKFIMYASR